MPEPPDVRLFLSLREAGIIHPLEWMEAHPEARALDRMERAFLAAAYPPRAGRRVVLSGLLIARRRGPWTLTPTPYNGPTVPVEVPKGSGLPSGSGVRLTGRWVWRPDLGSYVLEVIDHEPAALDDILPSAPALLPSDVSRMVSDVLGGSERVRNAVTWFLFSSPSLMGRGGDLMVPFTPRKPEGISDPLLHATGRAFERLVPPILRTDKPLEVRPLGRARGPRLRVGRRLSLVPGIRPEGLAHYLSRRTGGETSLATEPSPLKIRQQLTWAGGGYHPLADAMRRADLPLLLLRSDEIAPEARPEWLELSVDVANTLVARAAAVRSATGDADAPASPERTWRLDALRTLREGIESEYPELSEMMVEGLVFDVRVWNGLGEHLARAAYGMVRARPGLDLETAYREAGSFFRTEVFTAFAEVYRREIHLSYGAFLESQGRARARQAWQRRVLQILAGLNSESPGGWTFESYASLAGDLAGLDERKAEKLFDEMRRDGTVVQIGRGKNLYRYEGRMGD